MRRPRTFRPQWFIAVVAATACTGFSAAPAQPQTSGFSCDLSEYAAGSRIGVTSANGTLGIEWSGTGSERARLTFALRDTTPYVAELSLGSSGGSWTTLGRDLGFEFRVVEGLRRISKQQLAPLIDLGVELTPEVVDRFKWDVFWDAPLDLRVPPEDGNVMNRNPPPQEGVADQPGLPRSPDEIRRGHAVFGAGDCSVKGDGGWLQISFSGLQLGSFAGELVTTVFEGTNLIRVEAVASTALPSVAYKYDVGLTGLDVATGRVAWKDVASQPQSYSLKGPANTDPVALRAANRLVVAETNGGAIAAFPPPHTFFWAREVEINVGNNWYRKDDDNSFSFGIRQNEEEVVDRFKANWSLYSAPPGSEQHMAAFFYPTLGDADDAFAGALQFTNGDVYRPLEGYKVLGSHYHTDVGRTLMATGSVDSRLADFEVLRSAGIDIAGPVDRPRDATQLEEQRWLFEGAERHSDDEFMVMPQMENTNLLGGHWDLLFSHPVYYEDQRAAGQPLVTEDGVYHIGSIEDMMDMIEAEDMIVYMPHPRTKGSTGYPDAVSETPQFLSDFYRGVGWRWGMGSDLSEKRLSGKRVIPLLDDMNNWIADSDRPLKHLLGITETYFKAPGDDVYANGPVTYLPMNTLPEPGNYAPVVDALRDGDYFVTSGEVLIPSHSYKGSGASMTLEAQVQWTFPLDFVEVVTGDGETTTTTIVSAREFSAFGTASFEIPFDGTGQAWVRFAAWDAAGNGAMTMPVRIR